MSRPPWITALLLVAAAASAQTGRRYESEIFPAHTLQSNIQYGQSITPGGNTMNLLLDLYTGTGDSARNRPLVLFIHGGGFKGGDKVSNFGTRVCGSLARRGYVVASINYRTISTIPNDTVHFEAMLRAMQDAKGAVRFFRRYAEQYGVDTAQVFATGSSAGSITALHMAYLDSTELPAWATLTRVGGTFEGTSGNPGWSSRIQGVISNWGAIADYRWINGSDVPVFCVHGTADTVVPHDSSFADGPFRYGSTIVEGRARSLGIRSGLRLFLNTGHTLDNSAVKQDSAIKDFSAWLYTVLRLPASVPPGRGGLPGAPRLRQNYPNPFNPATTVEFELAARQHVVLDVYDTTGRRVTRLVDGPREPGTHRTVFDAAGLPSGVYWVRLSSPGYALSRSMVLLR